MKMYGFDIDYIDDISAVCSGDDISAVCSGEIKIFYYDKNMPKLIRTEKGDWIDLRSAVDIEYKAGDYLVIPLGVQITLPRDYEAIVAPRSSTFKNYGIIMANSIGIIDNSYCGKDDQWNFVAYALRDGKINKYDRIAQFRILENMRKDLLITEVDNNDRESRGGIGSTGIK